MARFHGSINPTWIERFESWSQAVRFLWAWSRWDLLQWNWGKTAAFELSFAYNFFVYNTYIFKAFVVHQLFKSTQNTSGYRILSVPYTVQGLGEMDRWLVGWGLGGKFNFIGISLLQMEYSNPCGGGEYILRMVNQRNVSMNVYASISMDGWWEAVRQQGCVSKWSSPCRKLDAGGYYKWMQWSMFSSNRFSMFCSNQVTRCYRFS